MKRKFRRTLSRILAGTMIVSSMFTNYVHAEDVNIEFDSVASESAVHVANDANDLEEATVTYYAATPEVKSTYEFKLTEVDPACDLAAGISSEDGFIRYTGAGRYHGTSYGIAPATGGTFEIDVPAGTTQVSFTVSKYAAADGEFAVTDAGGNDQGSVSAYNDEDMAVNTYEYTGDATTLTFTYSGAKECYIPLVSVKSLGNVPQALSEYSFDLKAVPSDCDLASGISDETGFISYTGAGRYHGTSYGIAPATGGAFEIMVAGRAQINFTVSKYAAEDGVFAVTDAEGNSVGSVSAYNDTDMAVNTFEYNGSATTLTFTYSGAKECYIPFVSVKNLPEKEPLAEAAKGDVYTVDWTATNEGGEYVYPAGDYDKVTYAENHIRSNGVGAARADKHGATVMPNDSFDISVAGPANIKILSCAFTASDGVYTLYDADGNVVDSTSALPAENVGADGTETPLELRYNGEAGEIKLVFTAKGQGYMHYLTVENDFENLGEVQDFEVWYDDMADPETKTFEPQTLTYGASKLRLNAEKGEKYAIPNENFIDLEREGKIVNAYKGGLRPQNAETGANCNDMTSIPVQGDGNCMIFTPAGRGMFTVWVRAWDGKEARVWRFLSSDGETGECTGYTSYNKGDKAVEQISFVAEPGYTYVICTTGQTNNFAFCGSRFIADKPITLAVDPWVTPTDSSYNFDPAAFELYDYYLDTKVADIDKETTEITVLDGHKYYLWSLDPGVGADFASSGTDKETLTNAMTSTQLSLREIPDTTLKGSFITSDGGEPDVQSVSFKNNISGGIYEAVIDEDGKGYTCTMKPGEYTTTVVAGSYAASDNAHVEGDGSSVNDIYLKAPSSNGYYRLPEEVINPGTKLTFNRVADDPNSLRAHQNNCIYTTGGSSITVPVEGVKKVIVTGWYSGTWDINGQNSVTAENSNGFTSLAHNEYITDGTETEVTVNFTQEKNNYIYSIIVCDVNDYNWETCEKTLQVPSDKFPTLKDAVQYIKDLDMFCGRPEGEEGRMTIELTDDIEEQIVFDAPYITLKGNGHEISWYYGVGSYFYSIEKTSGLYDETLFYDKYNSQEGNGNLWGGVAIVRGDYFLAEDTIFKNNYNYKMTDKYAADLASSAFVIDKTTGEPLSDVGVYSAKERSNAFYVEAKNIELYNCQVLSSQDSFGRNGSADGGYSIYCKDCVIGGNVDYICGEFSAVFDHCELQWKTYTDGNNNNKIGYITAAKTNPYVFRNCEITADNAKNKPLGYYGRTWGPGSNATFYATETNGYIHSDESWGAMNTGDKDPTFYEYMNTNAGSEFMPVASSAENVTPAVLPDNLVASYTTDNIIDDVLGGWKPLHYDDEPIDRWDGTYGDVWKDGIIDAQDASVAYQISLVSTFGQDNEMVDRKAADVDGEQGITANDATWILQKVLVSTTKFPVEKETDLPEMSVFIVGDSTACDYSPGTDASYYYKRVGFGTRLSDYFVAEADIVNLALSGRSSSSFTQDPEYQTLINSMKEGDYLIIAFGHNDEKAGDARYTDPLGDKDTAGSFKNSLYTNYIVPAQEKGVTPILCTPIVRRSENGNWSNNNLHIANGKSYSDCVTELGAELGLTVIDNTTLTKNLYDELTPAGTVDLHAWLSYKSSSVDNTHLNNYGAAYVGYLIADAIQNSDSTLAPYVRDGIAAPDKNANLIVNPDYVVPDTSDTPSEELEKAVFNQLGKATAPWFGTIFGDCGGITKYINCDADGNPIEPRTLYEVDGVPNVDITTNGNSVTMRYGNVEKSPVGGKISGSTDTFLLYAMEQDAASNFEISATAKVKAMVEDTSVSGYGQISFGAICLDRVVIDANTKETYDYVSAGAVKYSTVSAETQETSNAYITFVRNTEDSTLKSNVTEPYNPKVGDEIPVSIKKIGNTFTVTYGDHTTTYEKEMSGSVYYGFYVTRMGEIEFSNISYNNELVE